MQPEDYTKGEAFQAEKRTIFAEGWLPLCAEGQLAASGDYVAASVGGWSVVGVRGDDDAVRVLRNACRHQNMPVVGTPSGRCESFRCRFHGWTYDLRGKFLSAPPPAAPKDSSLDLDLASLATTTISGLVFFSLAAPAGLPDLDAMAPPAYGGTLVTEIACNWKVCVEHLLAAPASSADLTWTWPLLIVRQAGPTTVMQQVAPHTFLRTRLFSHVFGGPAEAHSQAAGIIRQACERLQMDRAAGSAAAGGALVATFHERLARAYAQARATT